VIKIEPLGGEETRRLEPMFDTPLGPSSAYYYRLNRNKKSLCINFKRPAGRDIVRELIRESDVVVENFRPGVMDALGLGRAAVRELNPRAVYCSISGFGHTESPHKSDPALAAVAEATAGVVVRSAPDAPPARLAMPLGDIYPGALALSGICMALLRRERTGRGSHVDIAMYDALLSLNEASVSMTSLTGRESVPTTATPSYTAPFGLFKASDGYLCIAVLGQKLWERFCVAIGREDLTFDPRLANGGLRAIALTGFLGEAIDSWLSSRPRAEAVAALLAQGVPAAPVARPTEIINDPQTLARQMMVDVGSFTGATGRVVGNPIRIAPTDSPPVRPIAAPGEDTERVLRDILGYDPGQVRHLAVDEVIGVWPEAADDIRATRASTTS
jgi:CoA:oxalate CoA-transferase